MKCHNQFPESIFKVFKKTCVFSTEFARRQMSVEYLSKQNKTKKELVLEEQSKL